MKDHQSLVEGLSRGEWVPLAAEASAMPLTLLPEGPGVVLSSGGSTGGRRCCLHPIANLDLSAAATAGWLEGIGLNPARCVIFNPLPLTHVSGLLPWWRSRAWGVHHHCLERDLMKSPSALLERCCAVDGWRQGTALLSLVPTQLARLLAHPDGVAALERFSVIWVGGAALPQTLSDLARSADLPLAPCYGATETAAMVAALPPQRFLAGEHGCGDPLPDVELRVTSDGALDVRTQRHALAVWSPDLPDQLQRLVDVSGWWRSGDRATLRPGLEILGRRDTAILSGGETVFPEQLEARLQTFIQRSCLPVDALLLLGEDDPEFGQRLVALVRTSDPPVLQQLQRHTASWPVAERPRRWLSCPDLEPSAAGKWQRRRWRDWLERLDLSEG